MNPNVTKFIRGTKLKLAKHSPEILMGLGITGMISTTVLAVRATPRALELIEEAKNEKWVDKLTPVDTVKAAWKCYIPAAITGVSSIACLICANSIHAKRGAALATAYKISEAALAEYSSKVIETVGEKKEELIRDKVAEEQIRKHPVSQTEVIVVGKDTTRFLEPISGRYFEIEIEKVRRAENVINRRLIAEMYMSLNEFYDEIGIPHTDLGDMLGWNIDDGMIDIRLPAGKDENDKPCLVIEFNIKPRYDYAKLF